MNAAFAMLIGLLASIGAGVCAYADGALLSLDADSPPADRSIGSLLRRRDRIHRALAFARVALQISAGAACAVAVTAATGLVTIPLLAFVLSGVALVVLSETTAREAGERAGVYGVARTRTFIDLVERGLTLVVLLGEWIDHALLTFLPPSRSSDAADDASIEQFRQVVASEADVGAQATSMLTGVFSLGETTVAEVLTPRVEIIGVERGTPWPEVVERVRSSGHSRVVAHEGDLDRVFGALYAKDLLPYLVSDTQPSDWTALVRQVSFVPTSKRVDAQLREFRDSRRHLAIVVDEFGGTAGLVTIDDILRLILSDIRDEFDEGEPAVRESTDGGRYHLSGRLTLDKVSDVVGADLRHDDVTTVGGLAYELFGRVPRAGESTDFRSWRLVVERVTGRRVERVSLERGKVEVGAEDGG